MPFGDMWDALATLRSAADGNLHLRDLWAQHNEHRIPLLRLQFGLEYFALDGTLIFLLGTIVTSCILLAVILTWPFAAVWRDRTVTLGFLAFAITMTLSPAGWENLTRPFQVSFVQAYLFAVADITLAVQGVAPLRRTTPRLVHLLCLTAIIGLGGAADLLSGERPRSLASHHRRVAGQASRKTCDWDRVARRWPLRSLVPLAVRVGCRPLVISGEPRGSDRHGAIHRNVLGCSRRRTRAHCGAGLGSRWGCLTRVSCVGHISKSGTRRSIADDVGSCGRDVCACECHADGAGRLDFGITLALGSRYSIAVAVFWAGVAAGMAPFVARKARPSAGSRAPGNSLRGLAYVMTLLAVALFWSVTAAPSDAILNHLRTRSEPMLAAHVAGVRDDIAVMASYPGHEPQLALSRLEWLRAEGRGPWRSGVHEALDEARRPIRALSSLASCRGAVDATRPVRQGIRLDGWINAPSNTTASRGIGVVDVSGQPAGVGLVGFYRPDVKAAGGSSEDNSGLVAYARSADWTSDAPCDVRFRHSEAAVRTTAQVTSKPRVANTEGARSRVDARGEWLLASPRCASSLPAAQVLSAPTSASAGRAAPRLGARRTRQPPPARIGAQPAAAAAEGSDSSTVTCASARTVAGVGDGRRASIEARRSLRCWRASTAASIRSSRRTCSARSPASSSAGATAPSSSSSRRAASIPWRALERSPSRRRTTRFELSRRPAVPRSLQPGHLRGVPARRPAHLLRHDEAGCRAARHRVRRDIRPPRRRRPVRRHRRSVADGEGRPGDLRVLAARPPLRAGR